MKPKLPNAPRPLKDLQQEYAQLKSRLADAEYQVFIYEQESQSLKIRMVEVNQEADRRNALEAEKAKEKKAEEEAAKTEAKAEAEAVDAAQG